MAASLFRITSPVEFSKGVVREQAIELAMAAGARCWLLSHTFEPEADVITALRSIQSRTRGGSDRSASSSETPLVLFEQSALVSQLALQAHVSQSKAAVPFTPREKALRRSEVAHQ